MKEISFLGLCSRLIQLSAEGNSAWCHRVWAAGEKIGGWMGSLGQERSLSIFSLLAIRNARDFCVLILYGRHILNHRTSREFLACLSLGVKLSEL